MNAPESPAELIARCENFIDGAVFGGTTCLGRIHFRWGMSQAACDTCGGWCGISVAKWERVGLAGAVPDTGRPTAAAEDVGVVLRDLADDLEETRIVARNDGEVQRAVGIGDALDMLRSRIAANPRRAGAVPDTGVAVSPFHVWFVPEEGGVA